MWQRAVSANALRSPAEIGEHLADAGFKKCGLPMPPKSAGKASADICHLAASRA